MSSNLFLLVDFENVHDCDLATVPLDARIKIFVGKSQHSIPFTLTSEAQRFGERLEWVKIGGDGRNNLDFHLVYYLGCWTREFKDADFVILSKDKDYDALIRHLVDTKLKVRRIGTLNEIVPVAAAPSDSNFDRACAALLKIEKKSRPRKRKTLARYVSATFKKLTEAETERVVETFFAEGLISESNNVLTYNF